MGTFEAIHSKLAAQTITYFSNRIGEGVFSGNEHNVGLICNFCQISKGNHGIKGIQTRLQEEKVLIDSRLFVLEKLLARKKICG